MKNILLCGINARFCHSSLALLCLKHAAGRETETIEFTINDSVSSIVRGIVGKCPDAVGFSCYIFNVEHVLKVASSVKRILPGCFILLGGPEVSFGSDELMRQFPFIDMIIRGAGEVPFSHFSECFETGDILNTPSACIRSGANITTTENTPAYDMNKTPFMYGDLSAFENKIVYYETSRGCPFGCAYCMSANDEVSLLPAERVRSELEYFIKSNVRQVKLVDRTFNFPALRARDIIETLTELSDKYPDSRTNFHLEITASLIDDKTLELFRRARKGLFHLEVGIQSTNPDTLRAVNRAGDTKKLLENARALCGMDNVKVHADLIAGLPLESYESFKKSFNDAFALKPDELQLGFLKVLKGSPMRAMAGKYDVVYTDYPPYEVLHTKDMSFDELSRLRLVEQILNRLYNSKLCINAINTLTSSFASPFDLFEQFALYLENSGYFSRPHRVKELFEELFSFAAAEHLTCGALKEALLLDWLYLGKPRDLPFFLEGETDDSPKNLRLLLSDTEHIRRYLAGYLSLSPREISKRCHMHTFHELFPGKTTLLFDYGKSREEEGFCQTVG